MNQAIETFIWNNPTLLGDLFREFSSIGSGFNSILQHHRTSIVKYQRDLKTEKEMLVSLKKDINQKGSFCMVGKLLSFWGTHLDQTINAAARDHERVGELLLEPHSTFNLAASSVKKSLARVVESNKGVTSKLYELESLKNSSHQCQRQYQQLYIQRLVYENVSLYKNVKSQKNKKGKIKKCLNDMKMGDRKYKQFIKMFNKKFLPKIYKNVIFISRILFF